MQSFEDRIKNQLGDLVFKLLQGQHTTELQAADLEMTKQTIADLEVQLAVLKEKTA